VPLREDQFAYKTPCSEQELSDLKKNIARVPTRYLKQRTELWNVIREKIVDLSASDFAKFLGFFEKASRKKLGISYGSRNDALEKYASMMTRAGFKQVNMPAEYCKEELTQGKKCKMEWGTFHENNAISTLLTLFKSCGMDQICVHETGSWMDSVIVKETGKTLVFNASPDGIVSNCGKPFALLEIKCPAPVSDCKDGIHKLSTYPSSPHKTIPAIYIPQIMAQLHFVNARLQVPELIFMSWTSSWHSHDKSKQLGCNIFQVKYDELAKQYCNLMLVLIARIEHEYISKGKFPPENFWHDPDSSLVRGRYSNGSASAKPHEMHKWYMKFLDMTLEIQAKYAPLFSNVMGDVSALPTQMWIN